MHISAGKQDNLAHYLLPFAKNRLIMRIKEDFTRLTVDDIFWVILSIVKKKSILI